MSPPRLVLLGLLALSACRGPDAAPDGDDVVVDAGPDADLPPDGPPPDSEPELQGLVQCPQTWTAAAEGS